MISGINFSALRTKLIGLSLLAIVPVVAGLFAYVLPLFEDSIMHLEKEQVKVSVQLTLSGLRSLQEEVEAGRMTLEDAQARGKELVRDMKYNEGGKDYMFVYGLDGVVIAHGRDQKMEGTDRSDTKDPEGKPYVREFMALGKDPGLGFVSYVSPKGKEPGNFPKVSYIEVFGPWKWIVGSGLYVDEVQEMIFRLKLKIAAGLGLVMFAAAALGLWFANSLSSRLQGISQELARETEQIDSIAQVMSGASQTLSAGASQQAAALQETTAAVEETSSMISKNAENAIRSREISQTSQETANQGKAVVGEMKASIEAISAANEQMANQIRQTNEDIAGIVKVITEIGDKTKVINDIVFQTKLLSFNASVEAARAGEMGKGFAVVAEEVGNLAAMSGNSAKEIGDLLNGSVSRVKETVESSRTRMDRLMNEGHEKVGVGLEKAVKCGSILDEIVASVDQVSQRVSEIASASDEQSRGIREITKAMTELDSSSQQNSATSQDAAASAEKLRDQVAKMRGMAELLNQTISGRKAS